MPFEFEINREVVDCHLEENLKQRLDGFEGLLTKQNLLLSQAHGKKVEYECCPSLSYKTLRESLPAGLDEFCNDEPGFAITDQEEPRNWLWVFPLRGGQACQFIAYGPNKIDKILERLSATFLVEFAPEQEAWLTKEGVYHGAV